MTTKQALYAARYWSSVSGVQELSAAKAARLRFRADTPSDPSITHRMVWNPHYQPNERSKYDSSPKRKRSDDVSDQ